MSVLRRLIFWLMAMGWSVSLGPAVYAGVDAGPISERLAIVEGLEWCLTGRDVTREQLDDSRCRWAPLKTGDYRLGFEERAAWLRFRLGNSTDAAIERWIEVGHPRMSKVQLHYRRGDGEWHISETGLDIPRAQRARQV